MTITNSGETDDRLVMAISDAAARVELHTHIDARDGVMQMREVEGGFPLPAGGAAVLERGGDHIMFMGIGAPWEDGGTVAVTLVFESGAEIALDLPIRIGGN
jgi:copper(I)-binding protein